MKSYSISGAAKNLSRLIREACEGEEVVITRAGKSIVKVVPVEPQTKRTPGGFEGQFSWTADAFDQLTDDEVKELGFE